MPSWLSRIHYYSDREYNIHMDSDVNIERSLYSSAAAYILPVQYITSRMVARTSSVAVFSKDLFVFDVLGGGSLNHDDARSVNDALCCWV